MAPTASRPKDETLTSVRVAVRVRPFTDAELDAGSRSSLAMPKGPTGGRLSVSDVDTWTVEEFALDHCYGVEGVDGHVGPAATQERLYRDVGEPALDAAWAGYNVGVVAFGQTGTGKTHALVGATQGRGRGITPRLAEALFARVDAERESNDGAETRVEVTAVEIHRERCRDLLERGATVDVNRAAAVSISSLAQLRHVLAGAAGRKRPIPILAFARRHAHHPHAFSRVHLRDAPPAAGEPTAPRRPRRRRACRRRSFPSRARRRRRVRRRNISRTRRTRTRARRRRGGVLDLTARRRAPRTLRREREDVDRRDGVALGRGLRDDRRDASFPRRRARDSRTRRRQRGPGRERVGGGGGGREGRGARVGIREGDDSPSGAPRRKSRRTRTDPSG